MVEYLHSTKRPSDRCMYPSKQCQNKRANKLNGQPHKLCEEHRQQANRNQKRLQQRRRMRQFQEMQVYVRDHFGPTTPERSRDVSAARLWESHEHGAWREPAPPPSSPSSLPTISASENQHPKAQTDTFWGLYHDDMDHDAPWRASLGTLSPLRVDDDERLREFTPEDIYILRALLLDP